MQNTKVHSKICSKNQSTFKQMCEPYNYFHLNGNSGNYGISRFRVHNRNIVLDLTLLGAV